MKHYATQALIVVAVIAILHMTGLDATIVGNSDGKGRGFGIPKPAQA